MLAAGIQTSLIYLNFENGYYIDHSMHLLLKGSHILGLLIQS